MNDLNKLCHSLGSLEAQIIALNANFAQLQMAFLQIGKRVGTIETRHAFWKGKAAALVAVVAFLGFMVKVLV